MADRAAELQNGLARRQAVAAARELLELLQDTSHVMSKVGVRLFVHREAERVQGV